MNTVQRWSGSLLLALSVSFGALAQEVPAEDVPENESLHIRSERPTAISVDFGFPKGLGLSVLHNLQPEWAVGASASHVLLWPTVGLFGRYYLEPQKTHNASFTEWRVFHHPGVAPGAYVLAPYWSTHLLYGLETRSPEGSYSHIAFGMGIGNCTQENLLLGFINLEVSFGGSLTRFQTP